MRSPLQELVLGYLVLTSPACSYNVSHDVFDFESELGWEGSNDKARGRSICAPVRNAQTTPNEP